jgi:hypothetical protein
MVKSCVLKYFEKKLKPAQISIIFVHFELLNFYSLSRLLENILRVMVLSHQSIICIQHHVYFTITMLKCQLFIF